MVVSGVMPLSTFILVASIYVMFSVFNVVMTVDPKRRYTSILVEVILMSAPFYFRPMELQTASVFLFLFFYITGANETKRRIDNGISVHFYHSISPLVNKLITALAFFCIILSFSSFQERNMVFSEKTFTKIYNLGQAVASRFYPEINFSSTIDDLAIGIAKEQLKGPQFSQMPEYVKENAIRQTAQGFLDNLSKSMSISLQPQDSLPMTIYKYLGLQMNRWQEKFGPWFLVGWALAVFMIIRSVGVLMTFILSTLLFFVYHLLVASDFIIIRGEGVTREVPSFV